MAETSIPEITGGVERSGEREMGKFNEIQGKLRAIASLPPDPSKLAEEEKEVEKLKAERFHLIEDAESEGLFNGIKSEIALIEMHYLDIDSATSAIRNINVKEFEIEAKAAPGKWNPDFKGMLEEYKNLSALVLDRARLKVDGATSSDDYKAIDRHIRVEGWSNIPSAMADQLARKHYETERGAYVQARAIAEAQGVLSPQQTLEDFREGEEYLKPTTAIVPGSEPRFWLILNEDEKREWYVRSTLMIAGYKKSMAKGTDELYMDGMREVGVDLNKTALKRIFGKRGVLPTVGIYTRIIGSKEFLAWKDEKDLYDEHMNPTEINFRKVFCNVLGNNETDAVHKTNREGLINDYGKENVLKLWKEELDLGKTCADSFYPHDGTWGVRIEESSFRALKKSVRYWLVTKGRDLLMTDSERQQRKAFFEGDLLTEKDISLNIDPEKKDLWGRMTDSERQKEKRNIILNLLRRRARDAEQIAWNFTFVTDQLETFDSREFRPAGTQRHPPSSYWSLFQWVPMHLQERFEAKVKRTLGFEIKIKGKKGGTQDVWSGDTLTTKVGKVRAGATYEIEDTKFANGKEWIKIDKGWIPKTEETIQELRDVEPKETWASLGPWAVYNISHGNLRNEKGKFQIPDNLKVMPDTVIRGPLFTPRYEGKTAESSTFYSVFNGIGEDVLKHPETLNSNELFERINWNGMNDAPFVPFIFDEMRWADVVQNVFKKGGERDSRISGQDLSEAVMNLRLTRRQRELLLMIYVSGVNPKARDLKPPVNPITYKGRTDGFLHDNPSYFYDLKS
jgi:hypothetical protein